MSDDDRGFVGAPATAIPLKRAPGDRISDLDLALGHVRDHARLRERNTGAAGRGAAVERDATVK
jgi:hypothetical protein